MTIVAVLILVLLTLFASAAITGLLVFLGWNWGVMAAFPESGLGVLSFWQSVCVGLIISVIGGAFCFCVKAR